MKLRPYAKAILRAAIARLTALAGALTDGTVTTTEQAAGRVATLTALAVMWSLANRLAGVIVPDLTARRPSLLAPGHPVPPLLPALQEYGQAFWEGRGIDQ
ncbi:hypothetical protein ACIBBG_33675 [Micromonospora chersina]|uniref:hypothetical protein n=1 Tax=Micromonospora chersina TaxID=47854 RepID=UPI0037912FCB